MADKITFKLENGLKVFMDKEIRDAFEERVYDKIKVEIDREGEAFASIDKHDFLVALADIDDKYQQKYGKDLIIDENWYLLKSYPHKVAIHNCAGDFHARNFYCIVMEKFIDYVMSIGSEGYAI